MGDAAETIANLKVVTPPLVSFYLVREVPREFIAHLETAVRDFMVASHMPQGVDPKGFIQTTFESIASATYLNTPGQDLWLGVREGQLVSYVLATITREVDGRLTYWVYQAWVRKDQRRQPWVKEAWQRIRTRAQETFCKHVVVVSSRNDKAYCRWLGPGWHRYAALLKEDI